MFVNKINELRALDLEYQKKECLQYRSAQIYSLCAKKVGRWRNNKEEIDIVAFDDKNIAFLECKRQNSVNEVRELRKFIFKSEALTGSKKPYYRVVTKQEFLEGAIWCAN